MRVLQSREAPFFLSQYKKLAISTIRTGYFLVAYKYQKDLSDIDHSHGLFSGSI